MAIAGTKKAPPLDMGLVAATRALAIAGEALDLLDRCATMLLALQDEGEFDPDAQEWMCPLCVERPHDKGCNLGQLLTDLGATDG